ncbi:MAG: hypothetical protein ABI193_05295, partial [Minicystis sp.]
LPGAESCPTEQTFRDLVAAQRGGLDPFTDRGPRRMVITIARRKGILQGKLVDVRYPRQTRRRLLR